MRRPLSLLPALVAVVAATIAGLAPVPSRAAPAVGRTEPLQVQIDRLTPSAVPADGRIRLRGSVTNVSDERWQAINVHAFVGAAPITSATELAEAVQLPPDAFVGDRITTPGTFDDVGSLDPGESASFSIELRRDQLPVTDPGVYWFGAHALGNTEDARDTTADGRARTFLPLVPRTERRPVRASLVVPVRRSVRHTPDGRIRGLHGWATDLSPGGRLASLVELGTTEGAGPVTWLVDPAVPDAVSRLVAGNPPRPLGSTVEPGPDEGDQDEEQDPPVPDPSPTATPADADATDASPSPAAEPGAAWLDALRSAMASSEVLALPYGDLDLAATATHDPAWYDRSVRRADAQLRRWRVTSSHAAGSPRGFIAGEALPLLGDETVILSDQALPEGGEPLTVARVDGHRVLFASSATALGGPGPEDPMGEIAMRQRILADAALRLLFHDRTPLLVTLPDHWRPDRPRQFWSGLDPDWVEFTDTDELGEGRSLPEDVLLHPVEEELGALDEASFEAADALAEVGRTLQDVLTENDVVAAQVLDEALTSLSYHDRGPSPESRAGAVRATQWIEAKLHKVRLRTPKGVTLSSVSGSFAATITNRMQYPVTVTVTAWSQGDVEVEPHPPVQLAAQGRQTVVFETSTSSPGVHYVRLLLTDSEGARLGAAQRVPIRSAQVSDVIWLILGVGVGLLFLAIAVRVVRRIRNERA